MHDIAGEKIFEGDYVVSLDSDDNTPHLDKVVGFTPKKVRVMGLVSAANSTKYPKNLLKVDAEYVEKLINPTVVKDAVGQVLNVGDYVYGSDGKYIDPVIFKVTGFTANKVDVEVVLAEWYCNESSRYAKDLVKIVNPERITFKILQEQN